MKIYTKTGDYGETGLFAGPRVGKEHARIEAYGTVDELAATLGLARSEVPPSAVDDVLARIQHELFTMGAELATPTPESRAMPTVQAEHVQHLEDDIDRFDETLPELKREVRQALAQAILDRGEHLGLHVNEVEALLKITKSEEEEETPGETDRRRGAGRGAVILGRATET